MEVVQCKFCKNLFQSLGGKVCADCLAQIEKDYKTVREYLYDHPTVPGVEVLSNETGVSEVIIVHLMDEGRLFASNLGAGDGICQVCKKPIASGTVCRNCSQLLELGQQKKPPEQAEAGKSSSSSSSSARPSGKMHIRQKP